MLASHAPAAANEASAEPLIMSGLVLGTDGNPLPHATVVAQVEKHEADMERTREYTLAAATSDAEGHFELRGALDTPSSPNPDGSVVLQISTVTPDLVWHRVTTAFPPGPAAADWTWPDATAIDASLLEAPLEAAEIAGAPMTGLVLAAPTPTPVALNTNANTEWLAPTQPAETDLDQEEALDLESDALARKTGTTAALDAAYAAAYRDCSTRDKYWENTSTEKKRKVPVGWAAVLNDARQAFAWSTTKKTTLGIAIGGSGSNYSGGIVASHSNEDSTSVSWDPSDTNSLFHYRIEWIYKKQREVCYYYGNPFYTGKVRYIPWKRTNGNAKGENGTTRFSCDSTYRIRNTATIWVSHSTTETWLGWFTIVGVPLTSRQGTVGSGSVEYGESNGTNVQRWYKVRANSNSSHLCGKGGYPGEVPFVQEV